MKKILYLFLTVSLVFSSCKKEEEDETVTPTVISGCMDTTMFNYNPLATVNNGSCQPFIYGCNDVAAFNYDSLSNTSDNSCCYISGCTDWDASNYNSSACYDDGSCTYDTQYSWVCNDGWCSMVEGDGGYADETECLIQCLK